MQVSLGQAISNVFSDKYDKKNMLVYVLVTTLTFVLLAAFSIDIVYKAAELSGQQIPLPSGLQVGIPMWSIIPGIFLFLLMIGMNLLTVHNAIQNKKGTIPNILEGKVTTDCLITPLKFLFALAGVIFIFGIITIIPALIPVIGVILSQVIQIILSFLLIVMLCGYFINFKTKYLFDFKTAYTKLKSKIANVFVFVLWNILLNIINSIIVGIIFSVCFVPIYQKGINTLSSGVVLSAIAISSAIISISGLIYNDMMAQLTRILYPPKKKVNKNQTFGEAKEAEVSNENEEE